MTDTLVHRGGPGYDAATQVFNLAAPACPAAAATVTTVEEIRSVLRYARSQRLPVRVHSTGHGAPTARAMGAAVLIRTCLAGEVEVDPRRRVARVPAGTRWGAVVRAAGRHGLTAAHGSSSTVGVVGYLLRGGLSYYGRRFGFAGNGVRAVELVTADGELRRVDAGHDPELFWALRGGGGGFGVVTAVEIDLYAIAHVITGAAFWPAEHAPALLRAWQRWTADAPREATTSLQILRLPQVPEVPAALRAGPVLGIDGAVLSRNDDDLTDARRIAADLLAPLRAIAEPVLDTWQETTPDAVLDAHVDPEDPVPIVGDHLLLDELGDDGAAEFLRVVGPDSGAPLISAGFRQLGGAYADPDPAGGALHRTTARYAYSGAGVATDPATTAAILAHCATVRAALSPWDTGRTVPSFVENHEQPQGHLDADALRRVDAVRARVDPDGVFRDDISPGAYGPQAANRPSAAA